jgi:hypothetical protein
MVKNSVTLSITRHFWLLYSIVYEIVISWVEIIASGCPAVGR